MSIDNMVFSDKSSDEDPHGLMNKVLPNISECNESSDYGNTECENSKNLDLLNQDLILAEGRERNGSSYTASSGKQHSGDFTSFSFRSKSTVFVTKQSPNALAAPDELSDIDGLLSSDEEKDSVSLSTKIRIEEKQLDLDLLSSEGTSVSTAVDKMGLSCSQKS